MKIISILLMFCFSSNILAESKVIHALEQSLDDYQYTMTVEWDQKDSSFYDQETEKFFNKMSSLIQNEGFQKEEILLFAEAKMSNKKALEALKLKMNVLTSSKSSKELAEVLRENSKDFYAKGASWNGFSTESLLIAAIGAVLVYALWFYSSHDCVSYQETGLECSPVHMGYDSNFNPIYGPVECNQGKTCNEYTKK